MKKVLSSFMAFLILILGSCQESAYIEDIQETPSKEQHIYSANKVDDGIVARLQAYNDSLYSCLEDASSVNGSSTNPLTLKKWLDISVADFLGRLEGAGYGIAIGQVVAGPEGALVGMAILSPLVGACRSYQTAFPKEYSAVAPSFHERCISSYIKMKEEISNYSDYYPTTIQLRLPTNKQNLQLEGAQHNIILNNIVKQRYSSSSLQEALNNGTISSREYLFLSHPKTVTALNKKYADIAIQVTYDFGEESNSIIDLYRKVIRDIPKSHIDIESISNRYISEIFSAKELQDSQKDNLISSICVLASSVEYWDGINNNLKF